MSRLKNLAVALAAFALPFAPCAQELPLAGLTNSPHPLVWDALLKHADVPGMTNIVYFTFWVTNLSSQEATILATETSCDCTVVEASKKLPWLIPPGGGGSIDVKVNTMGKYGTVTKTITVRTSHGNQVLTLDMKIPLTPAPFNVSARQKDMMAAIADRQAVFKGNCAPCHAAPASNASGAPLFESVCGICHTAEHRASMVPDLALLNHPTSAEYWRTNIIFGKKGTLMPAFGKSEGGILESNQVDSLVEYLMRIYPSRPAKATTNETSAASLGTGPSPAQTVAPKLKE